MIIGYLFTVTQKLGSIGTLYLGAVAVACVFTVGGIIHSLWSFIRGS